MTTTPRGAPELVSGQAVPETTVNEQVRHTEAGAGHFLVADNDLTAPPGACADGASYIIAATATGLWAGKENYIATAMGTNAASGWAYHAPKEGYTAYVQDENARFLCDGSAWALDTTGGSFSTASTTEQLTGTESSKGSTPDSVAALWEQGADVASAGTTSLGEGGYFNITGTTTITDIDFATDKAGRKAWVKFAGILTLTHNASTLILPTGASITTAAGDMALFVSEGSDVVRCLAYQRASGQPLAGGGGSGAITASGYTQATNKLLGRSTASTGAIEELTVGSGLSLAGGTLSATGGSGGGATTAWDAQPTVPVSTDFTLVKDAGTTASMTDKSRGVLLSVTGAGAADRIALMEKTTPGATWTMTALFNSTIIWRNYMCLGLYAKENSSGKIHAFTLARNGVKQFRPLRWNTITSFNSATGEFDMELHEMPVWVKLVLDASNLVTSVSRDGEAWTQVYTTSKTAFLPSIDRCGVFFGVNQQTAPQNVVENLFVMGFTLA
jgi:hypothetical protein